MRLRPLLPLVVAILGVALAHCGTDATGEAQPTSDGGNGDGSPAADGGGDDGASSSPFGLDARPANPTCKAPARPASGTGAKLVKAFPSLPKLVEPVAIQKVPGAARWWVVERAGRVVSFDANAAASSVATVLDHRASVESLYLEAGMLGIAFHPKFQQNGFVYVYYTRNGQATNFAPRITRFHSNDGGFTLDPASEKVLLDVPRTVVEHVGGNIAFGPDGYLYAGLGDESIRADAQYTADTPCDDVACPALRGKLIRIDVDKGDPYAIPPTNPFANGGGRKELFAWGFRNPWRWSFDRATGELWLGDVGEDSREEIDRVQSAGNYGWPNVEGDLCLTPGQCDGKGFQEPVAVHNHPESLALVAGVVYRGAKIPGLVGSLLYGDQVNGTHWALVADPVTGKLAPKVLNPSGPPVYVTSYGEDTDGEVFLVDYGGDVYTIAPDAAPPSSTFPEKLSQTGCFDASDPKKPVAALIPYGINVPFWSDGADKDRFFALPDGAKIAILPDGDLDLPKGSVVAKTFRLGGKRVETRLFVRHDDGDWAGYTYEWNDAETDATLLPAGKVKNVAGQDWTFPSRADCLRCHTTAAGRTLGLELQELARAFDYPGRPARDQLATLAHIDVIASPLPQVAALPAIEGAAPQEARARAYLHANCSFCHRPEGPTAAQMDLRFSTPFGQTKTCNVAPLRGDLGVPAAAIVKPGVSAISIVSRRMHATDFSRMPPLAIKKVDPVGTKVVDGWIDGLTGCP